MVSLFPSIAATLPLPNFRWKTRSPGVKAEIVPVDFATSSPPIVSGRRRGGGDRRRPGLLRSFRLHAERNGRNDGSGSRILKLDIVAQRMDRAR